MLERLRPGAGLLLAIALVAAMQTSPRGAGAQDDPEPSVHIAIGVPREDLGPVKNAGSVVLLLSDPLAPSFVWSFDDLQPVPANTVVFRQGMNGVSGTPERGDRFGEVVVFGDFDGDRTPDIAISAPGEDTARKADAGVVHVVHGTDGSSVGGLAVTLHPGVRGVPSKREAGAEFGSSLAVADINADGYDDLAVGTPRKDHSGASNAGEVHVFFGSDAGLTPRGSIRIRQGAEGIPDQAEAGDRFGETLAGDTGSLTLAIGVPREDVLGVTDAGAVQLIAPTNPEVAMFLHQGMSGFDEQLEPGDRFGRSVSLVANAGVPDFDLSIGVPNEDLGSARNAGIVHLVNHRSSLSDPVLQFDTLDLDDPGYVGTPESGQRFGWSVLQRGTIPMVGVPGDDPGGVSNAGSLRESSGVRTSQNTAGVPDANERGDQLGSVGAASHYRAFRVFGVPKEDVDGVKNAGMVLFRSDDVNGPGWMAISESSAAVQGAVERSDHFGDAVAIW